MISASHEGCRGTISYVSTNSVTLLTLLERRACRAATIWYARCAYLGASRSIKQVLLDYLILELFN